MRSDCRDGFRQLPGLGGKDDEIDSLERGWITFRARVDVCVTQGTAETKAIACHGLILPPAREKRDVQARLTPASGEVTASAAGTHDSEFHTLSTPRDEAWTCHQFNADRGQGFDCVPNSRDSDAPPARTQARSASARYFTNHAPRVSSARRAVR